MTSLADLERSYRVGFLRYLPRREEGPLRTAYEIGRTAAVSGVSVLDLAQIHHRVFSDLLAETAQPDMAGLAAAAAEFFLEALAPFDMASRGVLPAGDADHPPGEVPDARDGAT